MIVGRDSCICEAEVFVSAASSSRAATFCCHFLSLSRLASSTLTMMRTEKRPGSAISRSRAWRAASRTSLVLSATPARMAVISLRRNGSSVFVASAAYPRKAPRRTVSCLRLAAASARRRRTALIWERGSVCANSTAALLRVASGVSASSSWARCESMENVAGLGSAYI